MQLKPAVVVLLHLLDMVWDMAFLPLKPAIQVGLRAIGVFNRISPGGLGKACQQLVGQLPQSANQLERFASCFDGSSRASRPSARVQLQRLASRLGDNAAALYVAARFAIRKMVNDFVDAPAAGRRRGTATFSSGSLAAPPKAVPALARTIQASAAFRPVSPPTSEAVRRATRK